MLEMNEMPIVGQKGGGGGSAPVESPDSLHSRSIARVLDLVSEGEILGLVNGLQSAFLNETPIANPDGTLNFKNVHLDYRSGSQNQSYIPGFPSAENEIGIGVELRQETPWTRSFSNTQLSAVRVRLSTPQFMKTDTETGDVKGTVVNYAIDLSVDGGQFNQIMTGRFSGKTTTKFERSHRIDLPEAATNWTIRVRRLTPDSTSGTLMNKTFIESVVEVIDAKLRYPNSALIGLTVDAEQFSSIPTRAYELYGRIIRVPSNYDPETRTYEGIWDGTFKPAYSNNPAWIFYDIVTHKRFGLGHIIDPSLVDKWGLYVIAKYCDELVPDGMGGMEPRFTCNVYLQTRQEAYRVVQDLASAFRGMSYWSSGAVFANADMPTDPAFIYTPANVIDGKFAYQGSSRKNRYTVALVSWNDMSDFGRAKVEYVEDAVGIQRYGIHQAEITAIGCTSRAMARRVGKWLLLTSRYETDTVTFAVGLDGTLCAPGQIVMVSDPHRAGRRLGGRITAATSNTVTVDADYPAEQLTGKITVVLPDATTESVSIASVQGRTITVATPFRLTPEAESMWTVENAELAAKRYRVIQVEDNNDLTFNITALEHVEGKFDEVDFNIDFDEPVTTVLPPKVIAPPSNVTVGHSEVAGEVISSTVVNISWDPVPGATSYYVEWRQNNGNWRSAGTTSSTSMDIYGAVAGPVETRITAIGVGGKSNPSDPSGYDIPDQTKKPVALQEVTEGLAKEIIDRGKAIADEALVTAGKIQDAADAAAVDATNKANAALAEATTRISTAKSELQANIDGVAAQLADIYGADVWDPEKDYPDGDLVQDGGTPTAKLYRALQDVPAGTPLTSETHWQFLGNYSSLGEAVAGNLVLSTQTANEVEAHSSTLADHTARLGTAESNITELTQTVADNNGALASRTSVLETEMRFGKDAVFSELFPNGALNSWTQVGESTAEISYQASSESEIGGTTLKVGNNAGDDDLRLIGPTPGIAFDPTRLYRLRVRLNRRSSSGTNRFYGGFISEVGGNQYHISGVLPPVGEWTTYETYFRGHSAGTTLGGAGTIEDPRTLPLGTKFLRPIMLIGWSNAPGEYELDYFIVDDATAHGEAHANANAIDSISVAINQQDDFIQGVADDLEALELEVRDVNTGLGTRASQVDFSRLKTRVDSAGGGIEQIASDVESIEGAISDPDTGLGSKASVTSLSELSNEVDTVKGTVESQGSRIDQVDVRVGAVEQPAPNLIANPTAAANVDGWTGATEVGRVVSPVFGTYFTVRDVLSPVATRIYQTEIQMNALSGPTAFAWSMDAQAQGSGNFIVDVLCRDASNNILLDTPGKAIPTGFNRLSEVFSAPAGTTKIQLRLINQSGTITLLSWKRVKLERGDKVTPYSEEAQASAHGLAIDSMNVAISQQDDFIQGVADDLEALDLQIQNPTTGLASKASSTDFTTLKGRVDTVGGGIESIANNLTSVNAEIRAAQTVVNGGFELNTGWSALPASWSFYDTGTAYIYEGKRSLWMRATNGIIDNDAYIDVKPGDKVRLRCVIRTWNAPNVGSNFSVGFRMYDVTGAYIGLATIAALAGAGTTVGFQPYDVEFTVPANTYQLRTFCRTTGLTNDAGAFVDAIEVEKAGPITAANSAALQTLNADVYGANGLATKASSSALTAVEASIENMRSDAGVVLNPSFERSEKWVLGVGASYYTGSTASLINSGTRSLKFAANNGTVTVYQPLSFPAQGSQKFRARMAVRGFGTNAGAEVRCGLRQYRADGTYISTAVGVAHVFAGSAFYVTVEGEGTLHADCRVVEPSIYILGGSHTAGDIYVDDVDIALDNGASDPAMASALNALDAVVSSPTTGLATKASASDLSAVQATVGDHTAAITQINNVIVESSAVSIANPSFERDEGWASGPGNVNLPTDVEYLTESTGHYHIRSGVRALKVGAGRTVYSNSLFKASSGERFRVGGHVRSWNPSVPGAGQNARIGLRAYDADGNYITSSAESYIIYTSTGSNFGYRSGYGYWTAPEGVVHVSMYLAHGAGTGYVLFDDVFCERLTGTDERVLATSALKQDVDGKVSSIVAMNDGTESEIVFDFDNVRFESSDGGSTISGDVIVQRADGYMYATGAGFGANDDLVMWYGTERAVDSCTKANAIAYADTTGKYFIQSLQVGDYEFNANNGGNTAAPQTLQLVVNETNGGTKKITAIYSFSGFRFSAKATLPQPSGSATLQLWRKIGSGSFQKLGSDQVVQLTGSTENDPMGGSTALLNGNLTYEYEDTSSSLSTHTYEWRLVSLSSSIPANSQNMSLKSLE